MKYRMSDIKGCYMNHLFRYAMRLESVLADLKGFYGVDLKPMTFPTTEELTKMKYDNVELTDEQWTEFWKIIKEEEIHIARVRVEAEIERKEDARFRKERPTKYDEHGYAYYDGETDYDTGVPCRCYIEMGD